MMLAYQTDGNRPKVRAVTPHALLACDGTSYMSAHCHRDGREKMFRLDRSRQCWLAEDVRDGSRGLPYQPQERRARISRQSSLY